MTVKAWYVLTLPGDDERLAGFMAQPGAEKFVPVNGVDARTRPIEDFADEFDVHRFTDRLGRQPAPGEVGCMLGHRSIWQKIANNPELGDGDYAVVVEDDAELLDGFHEVSRAADRHDVTVLAFGSRLADDYSGTQLRQSELVDQLIPLDPAAEPGPSGHRIGLVWPNASMGMVAYVVSRSAARELLRINRPAYSVADDYIEWRAQGLTVANVRPSVARERQNVSSTIDGRGDPDEADEAVWNPAVGSFFVFERLRARLPLAVRRVLRPDIRLALRRLARAALERAQGR